MPELQQWILAGAAGAFIRICLVQGGQFILPNFGRTPEGRLYVDLGCITTIILGIGTAVLVDGSWITAFLGAIAGPHLIEEGVSRGSSLLRAVRR